MNIISMLSKYKCHKEVHAVMIGSIIGTTIVPKGAFKAQFKVDQKYIDKHKPVVGGYYVVYEDGYESFSPADVFEKGYTKTSDE